MSLSTRLAWAWILLCIQRCQSETAKSTFPPGSRCPPTRGSGDEWYQDEGIHPLHRRASHPLRRAMSHVHSVRCAQVPPTHDPANETSFDGFAYECPSRRGLSTVFEEGRGLSGGSRMRPFFSAQAACKPGGGHLPHPPPGARMNPATQQGGQPCELYRHDSTKEGGQKTFVPLVLPCALVRGIQTGLFSENSYVVVCSRFATFTFTTL